MPEVRLTRWRSRTTSSRSAPNSGTAFVSGVSKVTRPCSMSRSAVSPMIGFVIENSG